MNSVTISGAVAIAPYPGPWPAGTTQFLLDIEATKTYAWIRCPAPLGAQVEAWLHEGQTITVVGRLGVAPDVGLWPGPLAPGATYPDLIGVLVLAESVLFGIDSALIGEHRATSTTFGQSQYGTVYPGADATNPTRRRRWSRRR